MSVTSQTPASLNATLSLRRSFAMERNACFKPFSSGLRRSWAELAVAQERLHARHWRPRDSAMTPAAIIAIIRDSVIVAALGWLVWMIKVNGENGVKLENLRAVQQQLTENTQTLSRWAKE